MASFGVLMSVLGGGYLALLAGLYTGQRQLLYHGGGARPHPGEAGLDDLRVVETRTADGLRLQHWYVPGGRDAPVVAVFHGNAGDIGGRTEKYAPLVRAGIGLLLVEYRGFGGNPGKPSEAGLLRDARSALDWLNGQGLPDGRVVLYGESLGSGVAVALAAERPVGAVVLEAPFTSVAEVAQKHYWYVPAKWLVRDRFDSLARIAAVTAPLLVLHGGRDRTIPPMFGERLFAAASEPKQWAYFPEADHLDLWDWGAGEAVISFLQARFPVSGGGQPAVDVRAGGRVDS